MGEQLTVNGTPLRMQGFLSPGQPGEVAEWFRRHLGKPLVENTVAGKLVLGRPSGEFYLSVQLEGVGRGTRGLVAISHLKAGYERYPAAHEAAERLLARLPAGSRLISQMSSSEGGKLSRYLVISNEHGVELNRERVVDMMREDGLSLQREARPDARAARSLPPGAGDGRTLFFQGAGREAMALVSRSPDGSTTLVLHTLTAMERFQ
jgi:hypothetical protein